MDLGLVTILLLVTNGLVSFRGFQDRSFFYAYSLRVGSIIERKEYIRLLSSGFLHADWTHFGFNMFTLYLFGRSLEPAMGPFGFLVLYISSLLIGNLFAVWVQRKNSDYTAIGASGAVMGVVFASIALFPGMKLGLLLLPIMMPAWLFGLLYVLYSIRGILLQNDKIGHEAHLGGGLMGLMVALVFFPNAINYNTIPIMAVLIPTVVFLFYMILQPYKKIAFKRPRAGGLRAVEDEYNSRMVEDQKALDKVLDKINEVGVDQLTAEEKDILERHAKKD